MMMMMMLTIRMETCLSKKRIEDKPIEGRWLLWTLFKHKTQGRQKEKSKSKRKKGIRRERGERIQQVIIIFLSYAFILSFFSLFLSLFFSSKTVHLSASFSFSFFRTICFSISASYSVSYSSHSGLEHAKVNKNRSFIFIVTTEAHHHHLDHFKTYTTHMRSRKKEGKDDTRKTSKGNYVSMSQMNMPHK